MSTLNELVILSNDLETLLLENGGEVNEEIEAKLAALSLNLTQKTDAYASVIEHMSLRADYAIGKMKEWKAIADQCERAVDTLKERLQQSLKSLDKTELHGMEFSVKLQLNPPKCVIVDEAAIPGKYITTVVTNSIQKRDILDDLKEGIEVAGATIERSERIVIKPSQRKLR